MRIITLRAASHELLMKYVLNTDHGMSVDSSLSYASSKKIMIISLVDVHTLNLYHNETTELDQRPAYDRFHLKVTLCYTTASNSSMKVTIVRRVFYTPTYFYYANGCIFDKPIYQN